MCSLSDTLQEVMQQLFVFQERYQFSATGYAANAKRIVDGYNRFVEYYHQFFGRPAGEARMTQEAQYCARLLETEYNSLIQFIVSLLSSRLSSQS